MSTPLLVGLLLLAPIATLLWQRERTWLIALSQALGMQAVLALGCSGIQTLVVAGDEAPASLERRIAFTLEGTTYNLGGWTGEKLYELANLDGDEDDGAGAAGTVEGIGRAGGEAGSQTAGVVGLPRSYFAIVALQTAVVGMLMAWRTMRDDSLVHPVTIVMALGLIANAGANIRTPWW